MRFAILLFLLSSCGFAAENVVDWINFDGAPEDEKAKLKDEVTSFVKDNNYKGIKEIRYGVIIMMDADRIPSIDIVQFTYDQDYKAERTFDNNGKTAKELRHVIIIFSEKIELSDAISITCASLIHK
jgi:hypothetical protein